ncbi:MAG: MAPEG family protein [Alphaproteobacteria bacterium]
MMNEAMLSTDLMMLTWSAALCAVIWVPYILARLAAWGVLDAVGYPESPPQVPAWSARMHKAHLNLVENLVPFAALVLVAHVAGVANETTALGAQIFFGARVVHAVAYIFAVPFVRTVAFAAGIVGMAMIFMVIVGLI